jgi:hypothetical protein
MNQTLHSKLNAMTSPKLSMMRQLKRPGVDEKFRQVLNNMPMPLPLQETAFVKAQQKA